MTNINYGKRRMLIAMAALLLVSIWAGTASARSGGPDGFGYTFKDSTEAGGPTYNWVEISSTGTMILPGSDDVFVSGISVGFFFNYYGTDYSQVSISNNGIIFASGGSGIYTNEPIGFSGPHNFIAPFWDDLVTWNSADAIYYQTVGTGPNRMFVVEWHDNQGYSSTPSNITFEAILYEGSNNILFQYKDVDAGSPSYNNGSSATVGIEGPTGQGLQYSYNEAVLFGESSPGLAILFKFPAFSGTNMYLSKNAPANKDRGSTMTYTLFYNNFGNLSAANVSLNDTLDSNVNFVSASDGGTFDPVTRNVTWNIGSVANFSSGHGFRTVNVTIPSSVPVGTVIHNTAFIKTTTLETRYDDNAASANTMVTGSSLPPDVGVSPTNGNTGGTPSVYWHNSITFSYQSCPGATGVDIRIHINDGGPDIIGSMTGGPLTWTYTAAPFFPRHGSATITYTVHGCVPSTVNFPIYIDPAGFIYNINTGARISGATVTLQRPDGGGGWENVPIILPPIMLPNINPLITNATGQYQWDTIAGTYRVHVERPAYFPNDSIAVTVPPPVFDLDVGLTPLPDIIPPSITAPPNITTEATGPLTPVALGSPTVSDNLDPSPIVTNNAPPGGFPVGTTTVTWTATDAAGNSAPATQSVTITETIPPEAIIRFNTTSEDFKVYNSETGAEVSFVDLPQKLRQYTLVDAAGNSLVLVLKHKKAGKEAKVEVISMQYNGGAVIEAPNNKDQAEYSEKKNMLKELEQKIDVKGLFDARAKYSAKKGETEIRVKPEGQKDQKETRPSIVMLELRTDNGSLKLVY